MMDKGAIISECGQYRYMLWRRWDKTKPRLVFIMLNPSTADADIDDATIRLCMGRARRMGYGGIRVINLFAYRATNPSELRQVDDPVGPENWKYLEQHCGCGAAGEMTIAAWGNDGTLKGQSRERWREALEIICYDMGTPLYCLGLTKHGQPKHPLRISYETQPTLWMDRERWLKSISPKGQ
ncbi:DUF1643 domain-containing protein [Magnetovibrio sp.]|uniref:DUF1643 domain-containing protein n=1 Tax=Magnetovibrio sp. TaxID=2024836 RepID=UPI002F953EE5